MVEALPVDTPVAGFYRMRLRQGAYPVGIRVWYGPPHDPVTGEVMDRSWRWQATANGKPIDLDRVWPVCGKDPIDESEHDYLCNLQRWAIENAPDSPQADPTKRVNLLTAPIPL